MSAYLDNHSATKPCSSALERMRPYLEEEWGASFAPHQKGIDQALALDGRVQAIYDLIGAKPEDRFVFASSGADAIQQVLNSVYLELSRKEGKCRFVASSLEDAPLLQGLKRLEEHGCFAHIVPCKPDGTLDLERLREAIDPRTALVSISWAQGLTGIVQPIEEIAAICKELGVLLHIDATYAVGKVSLDFMGDYLTFAGDRMHGLKSSGALFAKPHASLAASLSGGSVDVPSLTALSAAAQQSMLTLDIMGLETARLRTRFEEGVLKAVPGAQILFPDSLRLPNVSLLSFPGVHQEALLYLLHRKKVYAAIGGIYHQQLFRLALACGCEERIAASAISFALSRQTTEQEIDFAMDTIAGAVRFLQTISGGV
jgi:cysteine desulfurase